MGTYLVVYIYKGVLLTGSYRLKLITLIFDLDYANFANFLSDGREMRKMKIKRIPPKFIIREKP